jgi:hypothetical protein
VQVTPLADAKELLGALNDVRPTPEILNSCSRSGSRSPKCGRPEASCTAIANPTQRRPIAAKCAEVIESMYMAAEPV